MSHSQILLYLTASKFENIYMFLRFGIRANPEPCILLSINIKKVNIFTALEISSGC